MELQPIKKKHNNKTFTGYDIDSDTVTNNKVKDLSLTDDGETLNSIWKCSNIWHRCIFLFNGELTIRVLSRKQPAIAVVIGDIYEKRNS